jgi:hypothetical protein
LKGRPAIRIRVCVPRELRQFYDQVRDGIRDEAGRFRRLGVEVLYRPVKRLGSGEVRAVGELIEAGINGLIVTPGNPAGLGGAAQERHAGDGGPRQEGGRIPRGLLRRLRGRPHCECGRGPRG